MFILKSSQQIHVVSLEPYHPDQSRAISVLDRVYAIHKHKHKHEHKHNHTTTTTTTTTNNNNHTTNSKQHNISTKPPLEMPERGTLAPAGRTRPASTMEYAQSAY